MKEELGSKKRAADNNAIIVSGLQSNAVSTLQSSKKSSCQMTIQTGMECTCQSDIHHTSNAILEMAIADFFIAKIFQRGLWSPLNLSNCWRRRNMWGVTLKSTQEKIRGKNNYLNLFSFYKSNQTLDELLDINFQSIYDSNKGAILTKAASLVFVGWVMEQPLKKCR